MYSWRSRKVWVYVAARATIEVALYAGKFLNDGLLNSKSSETAHLFVVVFFVYVDHGIFHPVSVSFFSKSVFGIHLNPPN